MPLGATFTVSPGYGKLADSITITGSGFTAGDKWWVRLRGAATWIQVKAASITETSATARVIALANKIDTAATTDWSGGLWDFGVCAAADSAPTVTVEDALYFYAIEAFDGDKTVAGPPSAVYVAGVGVGHLDGSVDIEATLETLKRYVNEAMAPVKIYKTGETKSLKLALAEFTLENIALAWGLSSTITTPVSGRRRLTFGGETAIAEKSVMMVLPGPNSKAMAIGLYKCGVTAPGTISMSKGAGTVIPVTFDVLCDTTRAVGDQVGWLEEYTP